MTNFTLLTTYVKLAFTGAKYYSTKLLLSVETGKMFNLFRKLQLVNSIANGLRVVNRPGVVGFSSEETPRRIEKSKSEQQNNLRLECLC